MFKSCSVSCIEDREIEILFVAVACSADNVNLYYRPIHGNEIKWTFANNSSRNIEVIDTQTAPRPSKSTGSINEIADTHLYIL